MDGIKELGGELFVVDDGWFGRKYRRTNDSQALGDWMTDTQKLPNGVPALLKAAEDRGLKFGIWIEPEMTNSKSELFEAHPDWVVAHPTRELSMGRGGTQLVLSLRTAQCLGAYPQGPSRPRYPTLFKWWRTRELGCPALLR